jgi:peptidyl-prolyl cis-trans isomerase A (cyclophilin A)
VRRALVLLLLAACGKGSSGNPLLEPSRVPEPAPETFRVRFETTKGDFLVDVYRDWSPHGVDRFHHLVKIGFYKDCAFFRVTPQFAQFGLTPDREVNLAWLQAHVPPDPPRQSNRRGFVSFAQGRSREHRTTQLFVNRADNTYLDRDFPPIGQVVGDGMDVVDALHAGYGDGPPNGPVQGRIVTEGAEYLKREFPQLDYIQRVSVIG